MLVVVRKGAVDVRRMILVILFTALAAGTAACSSSGDDKSSGGLPAATAVAGSTRAPSSATLSYEVVDTWTMPGGGPGESIVIPNSYLNDDDAVLLGAQLRNDTAGAKNAVVFIFTERRAADLRRFLIGASAEDKAFYQQHYAGQYTRNVDAGYHKLEMCYDGQDCTRGRTITY